jgi:hypothetical protein
LPPVISSACLQARSTAEIHRRAFLSAVLMTRPAANLGLGCGLGVPTAMTVRPGCLRMSGCLLV